MSKLSVCPSCNQRQVARPDIENRAVANATKEMLVHCAGCGASFTLGEFFRSGDRVSIHGHQAVVISLLVFSPGAMVGFSDGSRGACLFLDMDREGGA